MRGVQPQINQLEPPVDAFRFAAKSAKLGNPDANGRRAFSGVAYSGEVIANHWFWGNVAFDISSSKAGDTTPALVDHRSDRIAGTGKMSFSDEMAIEGHLSAVTEDGKRVAALADEGFPWQMSIFIEPGEIDEIKAGVKASVNGREVSGPLTIFRNNLIREVSFTPTGQDAQTSVQVFSKFANREVPNMPSPNPQTTEPTVAELQSQVTKLSADLASANARAEAAVAEANAFRKSQLTEIFKANGEELTEEAAKPFLAMSAEQFTAAVKFAAKPPPGRDQRLFMVDGDAGGTRKESGLVAKAKAMGGTK